MKLNKTILAAGILSFGIVFSVAMAYAFPINSQQIKAYEDLQFDQGIETSLVAQEKLGSGSNIREITKLYLRDKLIGVLTNPNKIDDAMKEVYQRDYAQDFPSSSLGLGEDVFTVKEKTYYLYDDVDDQIVSYLDDNNLYSILTNKVSFSNGAVLYVNDVDMFLEAREEYLLNFISKESYDTLKQGKKVVPLTTYGSQDTTLNVLQTMTVSKGLASEKDILRTKDDIIQFFSYGYGTITKEYYISVEGDTVEGVASKVGNNLSAQNLITLNPDTLVSEDQLLLAGTSINITYFDSPIDVVVEKEILESEVVYPESTKYIYDPTLEGGQSVIVSQQVVGKRNVRYKETYINGILQGEEEISSVVVVQAVQKVVRVGTYNKTITQTMSWDENQEWWPPVAKPRITCRYGCYAGHGGVDFQNKGNVWGLVYASKDGTVVANSYYDIGGYYMIIRHENGWYTYYGHMRYYGFYSVGAHVSKGSSIGRIGMTGLATGPHCHFEMWQGYPWRSGSKRHNPCKVVKFC